MALVTQLPGLPAIIDRITSRQNLRRLRFEFLQCVVDARADAGDLHRVQLLESSQRARLYRFRQRGDRGERDQLAVGSTYMVGQQLLSVEALTAFNLRDDAIA